MTRSQNRPVGDPYEPIENGAGRAPEPGTEGGGGGRAGGAWPPSVYDPPEGEGEPGSGEPDTHGDRLRSGDPALAQLLLDYLGEAGVDDERPGPGVALPLEAPGLRTRVLDRLEDELDASEADLLVATGPGAIDVGAPLADRTRLPLLREAEVPGEADRWRGARVALVGSVLHPAAIAGVLRAVEARGASVVAILGIAVRDGEDTELMSEHYTLFYIIHL